MSCVQLGIHNEFKVIEYSVQGVGVIIYTNVIIGVSSKTKDLLQKAPPERPLC